MGMKNVRGVDRALRIVVGVALLGTVFLGPKTPWGLVGLIPLVTALAGWCPAYTLFGLRTRSSATADAPHARR